MQGIMTNIDTITAELLAGRHPTLDVLGEGDDEGSQFAVVARQEGNELRLFYTGEDLGKFTALSLSDTSDVEYTNNKATITGSETLGSDSQSPEMAALTKSLLMDVRADAEIVLQKYKEATRQRSAESNMHSDKVA